MVESPSHGQKCGAVCAPLLGQGRVSGSVPHFHDAGPYHKLPAAIVGQCFRLENELIPQSGTWHMGQTMQNNGAAVSYPSS